MTPTRISKAISQWQQIVLSARIIGKPITFHGMSWEDYKNLQSTLGDDPCGVRISFNREILQIMPTSPNTNITLS